MPKVNRANIHSILNSKIMRKTLLSLFLCLSFVYFTFAQSQYNSSKGQNIIYTTETVVVPTKKGKDGKKIPTKKIKVQKKVSSDKFGNANGNEYDLAVDGAFEGNTIAVLNICGIDLSSPQKALKEKGFVLHSWMEVSNVPSPEKLKKVLNKSCQLWIISSSTQKLNEQHLQVIRDFFESGKGLYIWGDNDPFYADANFVAERLLGLQMKGNTLGDKVVGLQSNKEKTGLLPKHLITTGLAYVYEGITIATIQKPNASKLITSPTPTGNKKKIDKSVFKPLIYGSAGNIVAMVYEEDGKKAIIDGGFTRLFYKWDTAGTGRYVKNAAAWLVNIERFTAKK